MMIAPNKEGNLQGIYAGCILSGSGMETGRTAGGDYIREHSDVMVLDPREYFNTNRDYVWHYKTDTRQWNSAEDTRQARCSLRALGGTPLCP